MRDVPLGAYSVVPAGAAFHWETTGPIDFAHFYFDPDLIDHIVATAFDRNPSSVRLREVLGQTDSLVRLLALSVLEEVASDDRQQAYLDDMLHLMVCRVLRLHSNAPNALSRAPHALAPYRLRRAIDYIEHNLSRQIGVGEIAEASGVSRFHFSRAFRQTTGSAPYAYLSERRVSVAKALLLSSDRPLAEIGRDCGFTSLSQFSRTPRLPSGLHADRARRMRADAERSSARPSPG
ncbi:MAG: AraC family transcriptional regulator [Sphingomonadales bacterium]|nr:AraC family transcriptional regulator [Sphingomonadales bacterium]